jgi:hypothetical protein
MLREKGFHSVLRPADDGPAIAYEHRSLHQAGLREQQFHDGLGRGVVGRIQAELGERGVLPHEVGHWILEASHDPLERRPIRLLLQVLDDVELDAQPLGDADGGLGGVSVRVVEDRDRSDGGTLSDLWDGCAPKVDLAADRLHP